MWFIQSLEYLQDITYMTKQNVKAIIQQNIDFKQIFPDRLRVQISTADTCLFRMLVA